MTDKTSKAYFYMLSAKEHAAHAKQCLIAAIGNNAAAINMESDTYRIFTAKNISACVGLI